MIWLWITSLLLIGFSTIMLAIQYVYVFFFHKLERDGSYSFSPSLFGLMIFIGVLLLPIDLPMNRLLLASLCLLLDPSILCMLYLPIDFLMGKHKVEQDNDS